MPSRKKVLVLLAAFAARCRGWLRWGYAETKRRLVPEGGLAPADMALLRWVSLSAAVLLPVGILLVSGALDPLDEWQVEYLLGRPFYMEAEAVAETLLGRVGMFGLCVLFTLYLAAVLLHERRWERRAQVCVLALAAVTLPGMLCVLWQGMLYVAPAMLCVVLLWLLTLIPFFRTPRDAS